jgi:hypothetical protein
MYVFGVTTSTCKEQLSEEKKIPITKPVQSILLNVQPCRETNNSIGSLLLFIEGYYIDIEKRTPNSSYII